MFSIAPARCSRLTIEPTCSRIAGARDRLSEIKALGFDHPARNVIRAQQFACCHSDHAKAEPRQLIPGEVAVTLID
jgi:hypothetical protein